MQRLSHMKVRDFEAMKGIDYVTETNTYRAFYLSTHPSQKSVRDRLKILEQDL